MEELKKAISDILYEHTYEKTMCIEEIEFEDIINEITELIQNQ